jgi:uncharacterized protein YegJ (DUF2314 family)
VIKKKKRTRKFEREADKVEQLEKQVRELKNLNRSLMRQLKKLSKGTKFEEDEFEFKDPGKVKNTCEHCGKGDIEITELGKAKFFRCLICDSKGRLKK